MVEEVVGLDRAVPRPAGEESGELLGQAQVPRVLTVLTVPEDCGVTRTRPLSGTGTARVGGDGAGGDAGTRMGGRHGALLSEGEVARSTSGGEVDRGSSGDGRRWTTVRFVQGSRGLAMVT
jgi:hypothetical protein